MTTKTETLRKLLKVARVLTGRDLALETWAPGDGWTRYRVSDNAGSAYASPNLTKGECEVWLRAFVEGARSALGDERVAALYSEKGNPWAA